MRLSIFSLCSPFCPLSQRRFCGDILLESIRCLYTHCSSLLAMVGMAFWIKIVLLGFILHSSTACCVYYEYSLCLWITSFCWGNFVLAPHFYNVWVRIDDVLPLDSSLRFCGSPRLLATSHDMAAKRFDQTLLSYELLIRSVAMTFWSKVSLCSFLTSGLMSVYTMLLS